MQASIETRSDLQLLLTTLNLIFGGLAFASFTYLACFSLLNSAWCLAAIVAFAFINCLACFSLLNSSWHLAALAFPSLLFLQMQKMNMDMWYYVVYSLLFLCHQNFHLYFLFLDGMFSYCPCAYAIPYFILHASYTQDSKGKFWIEEAGFTALWSSSEGFFII